MVRGESVRLEQDEVADEAGVERHLAADHGGELDLATRDLEAYGELGAVLGRVDQAPARVLVRPLLGLRLPALGLELLGRAEAFVGLALSEELDRVLLVEVDSVGLSIGGVRTAFVGSVVAVETEPVERFVYELFVLGTVALDIGVVDSEGERTLMLAGEQHVIQGGRGRAQVREPGWARGNAHANGGGLGHRRHMLRACLECSPWSEATSSTQATRSRIGCSRKAPAPGLGLSFPPRPRGRARIAPWRMPRAGSTSSAWTSRSCPSSIEPAPTRGTWPRALAQAESSIGSAATRALWSRCSIPPGCGVRSSKPGAKVRRWRAPQPAPWPFAARHSSVPAGRTDSIDGPVTPSASCPPPPCRPPSPHSPTPRPT